MTAFAVVHAGERTYKIYKDGLVKYKETFVINVFQDTALYGKVGILIFTSIIMIQQLTTKGEINSEELREPIAIAGIISTLMGIYWAFEVAGNITGKLDRITDKDGNYLDGESNLRNNKGTIIRDKYGSVYLDPQGELRIDKDGHLIDKSGSPAIVDGSNIKNQLGVIIGSINDNHLLGIEDSKTKQKYQVSFQISDGRYHVTEAFLLPDYKPVYDKSKFYTLDVRRSLFSDSNYWKRKEGSKTRALAKSIDSFLGASLLTATSLVTYSKLDLAEKSDPDIEFLINVRRFYAVCDLLSEKGLSERD